MKAFHLSKRPNLLIFTVFSHIMRFLIFGIATFFTENPAKADLYAISAPIFSGNFIEGDYLPVKQATGHPVSEIRREYLHNNTLWFSFSILGGPKAVERLKLNQRLGAFVRVKCDGRVVDKKIPVGIDQHKWLRDRSSLEDQVRKNGFFRWRTFAKKENTECKEMQFRVSDDTGQVISPPDTTSTYNRVIKIIN